VTLLDSESDSMTLLDSEPDSMTLLDSESDSMMLLDSEPDSMTLLDSESDSMTLLDSEPDSMTLLDSESNSMTLLDFESDSMTLLDSSQTVTFKFELCRVSAEFISLSVYRVVQDVRWLYRSGQNVSANVWAVCVFHRFSLSIDLVVSCSSHSTASTNRSSVFRVCC